MEQENTKNNTWLIIILILLVLGLTGYIVYDKVLSKEEVPTEEINVEVTEKGENKKNIFKDIIGKYYYSDGIYPCGAEEYTELVLNQDGTFKYNRSGACAEGERMEGTYALTENKIKLYNNLCTQTLYEGKCQTINCSQTLEIEYNYNSTKPQIILYKDKIVEKQ